MAKISRQSATILIVIICVVSVYATKFLVSAFRKDGSSTNVSRMKGSNNAPIKVTEFIDFQCPACAHGAAYLKKTIEEYPEAIRLELRHYPLQSHQYGFISSRYAECAARQEKFWPVHDLLLARQSNWKRLADATPAFEQIAIDSNLDQQELKACLDEGAVDEIIQKNKDEGKALGIRSTPTYFVNGKMIVGKKSLEDEITKLLEKNGY